MFGLEGTLYVCVLGRGGRNRFCREPRWWQRRFGGEQGGRHDLGAYEISTNNLAQKIAQKEARRTERILVLERKEKEDLTLSRGTFIFDHHPVFGRASTIHEEKKGTPAKEGEITGDKADKDKQSSKRYLSPPRNYFLHHSASSAWIAYAITATRAYSLASSVSTISHLHFPKPSSMFSLDGSLPPRTTSFPQTSM
ncbi:hypothetical protein LR48_Vigan05g125900 [Vigna angularis]|uniref:Uncharacterized protein n=1 Tax=Phaseolus angularis TaxID=3914 RepID=A0A0L9UM85_PHAAN|nr:hypothetical protein LR48_Vigan05g125900 [Vigna angularis]